MLSQRSYNCDVAERCDTETVDMVWFQGGIAEAVAASKAKNAIFVVFVEGWFEVLLQLDLGCNVRCNLRATPVSVLECDGSWKRLRRTGMWCAMHLPSLGFLDRIIIIRKREYTVLILLM